MCSNIIVKLTHRIAVEISIALVLPHIVKIFAQSKTVPQSQNHYFGFCFAKYISYEPPFVS